jgi:hypothetical protein
MLTKAEVCRRCQCSKETVDAHLSPADYTKSGRPLFSEEDVIEFATDRQERKEQRSIEKAARQANRERYDSYHLCGMCAEEITECIRKIQSLCGRPGRQ